MGEKCLSSGFLGKILAKIEKFCWKKPNKSLSFAYKNIFNRQKRFYYGMPEIISEKFMNGTEYAVILSRKRKHRNEVRTLQNYFGTLYSNRC